MAASLSAAFLRLRAFIAERMLGVAKHLQNSMLGSGQRTNRD